MKPYFIIGFIAGLILGVVLLTQVTKHVHVDDYVGSNYHPEMYVITGK